MPQTNYQRAAERERKIVNSYRNKGWIAFRSAGSHSPIDVIAFNPQTKELILIQSKIGCFSEPAKHRVQAELDRYSGTYNVKALLDHRP